MAATASKNCIHSILAEGEALIRQGQLGCVTDQMSKFSTQQLPRELKKNFANLCRRTDIDLQQNDFSQAKQNLRNNFEMFDHNKGYDLLLISKKFAIIQTEERRYQFTIQLS